MKLKKLMILSAISLPVVAFAMSAKKCGGDTATPAVPGLPGGSNNGTNPGGGNNTNPGGGNTQNPGSEAINKAILVESNETPQLESGFKYGDLSIDVENATVTFDKEDFFSELKSNKKDNTKFEAFFSYSSGKFQGKSKTKKPYEGTPLFTIKGVDSTTQAVGAENPLYKNKQGKVNGSSWIVGKLNGDKITFTFRLFNFKAKTVSKNVYSVTLIKK